MSAADTLQMLQTVLDPHTIFPSLETPYAKYSKTNYAAPILELPTIRDIVSQRNAQLNDVNTIIERLETALEQFQEKRDQIISSKKAHEGFASCIRRTPLEILREIFTHCLSPRDFVKPSAETAPLLLTRICRDWRDVALNTPKLWSSLFVKRSVQHLFYCHDWLRKAKTCPLSLEITVSSQPDDPSWTGAALAFLQVHSGHLMDLDISFDKTECLDLVLQNVPMLERLSLSGVMKRLQVVPAVSIAQPRPRLRTLAISSSSLDATFFPTFDPGWTNLTHLTITLGPHQHRVRDPVFLTFLRMCPNLVHFVISPVLVSREDVPVPLSHPKLRFLDIDGLEWSGPVDMLTFPNLRGLSIDCVTEGSAVAEDNVLEQNEHRILEINIESYIESNKARHIFRVFNPGWADITHLRMHLCGSKSIFLYVLELCPNLKDAVVSSIQCRAPKRDNSGNLLIPTPICHPILRSLTIKNPEGRLRHFLDQLTVPDLRHLDISLSEYPNWPHEVFKAFLSRSQCQLETLKIRGAGISLEEQEEFGTLVPTLQRVELYDLDGQGMDAPVYSWTR